jgi:hypothetical protein
MADLDEPVAINDQLVLISGESASGKSASLQNIPNKERWIYCNCEAGKRPPFRGVWYGGDTKGTVITDPYDVFEALNHATGNDKVDGVIIDTLTFLMDMYESQYVLGTADTMKGWSNYQQFFKELMQVKIALLGKPAIILAHTKDEFDAAQGIMLRSVPVKGSLKGNGIEAYFSTVVSTKKLQLKSLKDYENDYLTITEDDKDNVFKHVFQTRLTKDTIGERIRAPIGMFNRSETFIDNDVMKLLRKMDAYYGR